MKAYLTSKISKVKNALQSLKESYVNPIRDCLYDYCCQRVVLYMAQEQQVREEIILIGLPVPEDYIGYITHPVTTYRTYETYIFYCSIVIRLVTGVTYFVKQHKAKLVV